jgi:hypothetical protein
VVKFGIGVGFGIRGDGPGMECLMHILMEDMAMAILGELFLRKRR